MSWLARLAEQARQREQAGLRRSLRPRGEGEAAVDLAGNDYLGLAGHPDVIAAAAAALKGYGLGATASRLVRGSTAVHAELEAALAQLLGTEAALVYSSGYLANLGAVRALAAAGVLGEAAAPVASDAHNHASIIDACRLAGAPTTVYSHADSVACARTGGRLIITESVFSVFGDLAPLVALADLASAADGVLLVDEAHALGVIGASGAGGVSAAGLAGRGDVVITATLSKALGAAGGVVAGPATFIRHLVETGRTFIYDTGLPPSVAAGALAALELSQSGYGESARIELADRAGYLRKRLGAAGFEVTEPAGGVLSVLAPSPQAAVAWARELAAQGVAVGVFRPPSTPDGSARLRITINTGVAREDFERAVALIASTG